MGGCSAAWKFAGGKWVSAQGSQNGVGAGGYPNSEQPGHGPGLECALPVSPCRTDNDLPVHVQWTTREPLTES